MTNEAAAPHEMTLSAWQAHPYTKVLTERVKALAAEVHAARRSAFPLRHATMATSSGAGYKQISLRFAELDYAEQVREWFAACGATPAMHRHEGESLRAALDGLTEADRLRIATAAAKQVSAEAAAAHARRLAAAGPGACPECYGEGDVGGQFCGGYQQCEACGGTGKVAPQQVPAELEPLSRHLDEREVAAGQVQCESWENQQLRGIYAMVGSAAPRVKKVPAGVTWDHSGKAYVSGPCGLARCEINPCNGSCKTRAPLYDKTAPEQGGAA